MTDSRYITLPDSFKPETGYIYGGLEGKADCEPYTRHGTGQADLRWMSLVRVSPGSASVFPVKLAVPGRGEGQFKYDEVVEWRYERVVLEALVELDQNKALWAVFADRTGSAIPPGIDPQWAWYITDPLRDHRPKRVPTR